MQFQDLPYHQKLAKAGFTTVKDVHIGLVSGRTQAAMGITEASGIDKSAKMDKFHELLDKLAEIDVSVLKYKSRFFVKMIF